MTRFDSQRSLFWQALGVGVLTLVISAACSTVETSRQVIPNQGGVLEGHTPRGFEGSGTGLFAGDELNRNFPPDDGVQIWLTFDISDASERINTAVLSSEAMTVRGNPFEALGSLQAAPVRFDEFSRSVVGIAPIGDEATCEVPTATSLRCDVAAAVQGEIDAGRDRVQFRLRFEGVSDPDGEQDMALFFHTDSNTNEPGIFTLELQ